MWSMHNFPFLKPAGAWHSRLSTADAAENLAGDGQ